MLLAGLPPRLVLNKASFFLRHIPIINPCFKKTELSESCTFVHAAQSFLFRKKNLNFFCIFITWNTAFLNRYTFVHFCAVVHQKKTVFRKSPVFMRVTRSFSTEKTLIYHYYFLFFYSSPHNQILLKPFHINHHKNKYKCTQGKYIVLIVDQIFITCFNFKNPFQAFVIYQISIGFRTNF